MNIQKQKQVKRVIRHNRVRGKVFGSEQMPRLAAFKANRHIYAQVIDDVAGKTIASASSLKLKVKGKKVDVAKEVGKEVAAKAMAKNIKKVTFDRGGFAYHGRIKSLAEGAREGGLEF